CDDLLTEMTNLTAKQTERKSQVKEVMSALNEAQQSFDTLKAADITEIRSFAYPFDTLGLIDYCMLIYLDHPSIGWKDVSFLCFLSRSIFFIFK
ncbi:unnamed protein product, partial [Rotaria sp. Silwood2]